MKPGSSPSGRNKIRGTVDDVREFAEGVKRLRHPTRGRISLTYVALSPEGQPDLSFVSYLVRPESDT